MECLFIGSILSCAPKEVKEVDKKKSIEKKEEVPSEDGMIWIEGGTFTMGSEDKTANRTEGQN